MRFIQRNPLSVNSNPSAFDTLVKRVVIAAYVSGFLSVDVTQHLVNRFQLWSA
jgi:hypothetical protein